VSLLAGSFLAAFTFGLVDSGANPTTKHTNAPGKPTCYPQRPGPVTGEQTDPSQPLCGSLKNDTLISKNGHNIEAFKGNDTICANNGYEDDIWGGPEVRGGDRALVDAEDLAGASPAAWGRKRDIETVTRRRIGWAKKACPRRGSYAAATLRAQRPAQTPLRGPAYGPIIFCDVEPGTTDRWRIWFPQEPVLRAADQGRGIQWQTVAWSAVLYKQEGLAWIESGQTIWLWDRTFEEGSKKPFIGHYWRRFTGTRDRRFVLFYPTLPGTYRVEIKYHWYRERPRAADFEGQAGDDDHVGPNETDGNHDSCTFPMVLPPPPGAPAAAEARSHALDPAGLSTLGLPTLPAPKPKFSIR